MRLNSLLPLLAAPIISVPAGAASLLVNGSFENTAGGLPTDWLSTGNLGTTSGQGTTDGSFAVAFSLGNVPSTGVLSQTFITVAFQNYTLTFDFGKYSVNQPAQVARLEVDAFDGTGFLGTVLLSEVITDNTPGPGNSTPDASVYDSFSYSFTALGTSTTLRFSDTSDAQVSGGGFDAMLDNVAVTAVPEPSVAWFAATSLLAFGRRRLMA